MPYILAILLWTLLVFTGIGLLALAEPLWRDRSARAREAGERGRPRRGEPG